MRIRRRGLELTQQELAARVHCAAVTVRKIESGERRPSPSMARRLAAELGIAEPDRARFLAAADARLAADRLPDPARAGGSWPAELTAPLFGLVGRHAELSELAELLSVAGGPARLVTITGPPGVGKTRLAVELAGLLGAGPGGVTVRFASLAAVTEADLALPAIVTALGSAHRVSRPAAEELAGVLGDGPSVLVVDNLEQVVEAGPELAALLGRLPELCLVTTSRVRLAVYGEHGYVLEPLPMPAATELLAAQTRDRSDRQRTMLGAVDWSYRLLAAPEQLAYRVFAVFAGGATPEAAAAVLGGCGVPDPASAVAGLVENSLLQQTGRGSRLAFFEIIREHAARELDGSGATGVARAAHAAHYLGLAEQASALLLLGEDHGWLERLGADHHNLRAALRHALDHGPAEQCLRLVGALAGYWHLRGHWTEGRRWATAALARRGGSPVARAAALRTAGLLAWAQDECELGATLLDEAVRAARRTRDAIAVADTTGIRGLLGLSIGDPATAAHLRESREHYRLAGSTGGVALSEVRLGMVALADGDTSTAAALFDAAIEHYRVVERSWGLATALANRADVHRVLGEWPAALTGYARSFEGYTAIGTGCGCRCTPWTGAPYVAGRGETRAALGHAGFGRLVAEGVSWADGELAGAVRSAARTGGDGAGPNR